MPEAPAPAPPLLRGPRALLAVLTIVAFANAVPNGFVWLDHWQIENGGLTASSWADLWHAWQQPLGAMPGWEGAAPYARPVVVLVLSLVHGLAGNHAGAYHAVAVLLHCANVVLVYELLTELAGDSGLAFVAAALFAVHPLQTAAVSWISGIADPLFTVFVLLAFRFQLAADKQARVLRLRLAAVLCFLLALGAKETAAVFPFLLLGSYALLPTADCRTKRTLRGASAALAPFVLTLVGIAAYRIAVLGNASLGTSVAIIPLRVRLLTLPRLVFSYLALPLRVGSLTICDDYPLSSHPDAATLFAVIAIVLLLAAVTAAGRRVPAVAFGVLFMLFGLLPVLNIIPILHYRADRFFYFPFIGWALAVVTLLQAGIAWLRRHTLLSPIHLQRCTTLAGVVMLVALASLTIRRNALFADDVTLFEATVRVSPACREAHTGLGDAYLRADRTAAAVAEYEQALPESTRHASYAVTPKILINLGMARLRLGDYAPAADAFRRAHDLQPELLHPLFGLGAANLGLGNVADAAGWLEQAYARDARDPDIVFNLALADDRLGRTTEAIALYEQYLHIAPQGRARGLAEARMERLFAGQKPAPQ